MNEAQWCLGRWGVNPEMFGLFWKIFLNNMADTRHILQTNMQNHWHGCSAVGPFASFV